MNSDQNWQENNLSRKSFISGLFLFLISISPLSKAFAATKVISVKLKNSPNSNSATLVITTTQELKFFVEYGYTISKYDLKTSTFSVKKNSTSEIGRAHV